ncbi:MAG TPA: hypothetical protein VF548_00585 [Allosphingosinicella sp.]|jgi:hypothetical protein
MSRPLALPLLLAIGATLGGCGERRPEAAPTAAPRAAKRDCPTRGAEPAKGSVCIARRGPNWTYAFVYPPEAARIPALDSWLRSQSKAEMRQEWNENDADGLGALSRYAKEHPEGRFFHEKVYTLDSDLPGLLSLSKSTSEYSGGAHGWYVFETLLWDKAGNRMLEPEALFSDPAAANSEIGAQLCPVLAEARRREAARGGGFFRGPCTPPPYDFTLLGAGGQVTTLKITFNELDGYAGGTYEVHLPVTERLRALVAKRFRTSFAVSGSPARACNSNLDDCVVAGQARRRQTASNHSDEASAGPRDGGLRHPSRSVSAVPVDFFNAKTQRFREAENLIARPMKPRRPLAGAAMERSALFASLRLCVFAFKNEFAPQSRVGSDGAASSSRGTPPLLYPQ